MKTLNQLYVILLEYWQNNKHNQFICHNIDYIRNAGLINATECFKLKEHFLANKPSKKLHVEFFNHPEFFGQVSWWVKERSEQKKLFLEKMIEITDERTPLQKLAARIERDNELFNSLTTPQKRVAVAQDALERVNLGQIRIKKGTFCSYSSALENKPIKGIVNQDFEGTICDVCAKGGLFISYVGRVNNFNFEWGGITNNEDNDAHEKLLEIFSYKQLSTIEYAFEGRKYMKNTVYSDREEERAEKFYKKYSTPSERLKAICENIIRNKGTFKL